MIKIGIDPSGTGTTTIVVFENNKLIDDYEFINKDWIKQIDFIRDILCDIWKYNNYMASCTMNRQKTILVRLFFLFFY